MRPATVFVLIVVVIVLFVVVISTLGSKCGNCAPEPFIPLNDSNLPPEARMQARMALMYLDRLKKRGEDPADMSGDIDPTHIVMVDQGYSQPQHVLSESQLEDPYTVDVAAIQRDVGKFRGPSDRVRQILDAQQAVDNLGSQGTIEGFSASLPSTEIEPNKTWRWWYYNYPYLLTTDGDNVGTNLNGGNITSNWWIGARYRNGMFPAATWRKWNGNYMYVSNDGVTGAQKVAPLG